jgi:ribosomal protein S5
MARNRFSKVTLAVRESTNLMNAVVVGQSDGYLLLERPEARKRTAAKKPATVRASSKSSTVTGNGGNTVTIPAVGSNG